MPMMNGWRGGCDASSCKNIKNSCTDTDKDEDDLDQSAFTLICKYAVLGLASLSILREVLQIFMKRMNYLGLENLIEWITYVSSILLVLDVNKCQMDNPGVREVWQWQLASVAILFAWLELVLFIRKIPRFGIFVVMFTDIFWTFLQFLPVFFLFIVAFGLTFFVLFGNQVRFESVEWSLLTTFVMMIGELEYSDLFFGDTGQAKDTNDFYDTTVNYEPISYIVFTVFLALLTILIMNLLVGLAVDDIKAVQDQAVLKRLAMQVKLALDVESLFPDFIHRRVVRRVYNFKPNKKKSGLAALFSLESSYMNSDAIARALDPELTELEQVQENQEKLLVQVTNMRQRMKAIDYQNQRLESMLAQIMKAQGIEFVEEDVVEEEIHLLNIT